MSNSGEQTSSPPRTSSQPPPPPPITEISNPIPEFLLDESYDDERTDPYIPSFGI